MPGPHLQKFRAAAVMALLAGAAAAAHAGARWSVDLSLGLPMAPVSPVYGWGPDYGGIGTVAPGATFSVQVGGGRYSGHGRYGHHGHHGHYGPYGQYGRHGGGWGRPWGPSWVIVAPPLVLPLAAPAVTEVIVTPPLVLPPSRPDPVIYPRNAQDAPQTEFDRQQCNRWATTQPAALADAAVFQRAVEACMDARGYSMK